MDYFLSRDGQQAGPFSEAQVFQMWRETAILGSDLCWHKGMSEWKAVASIINDSDTPPPLPVPIRKNFPASFDSQPKGEKPAVSAANSISEPEALAEPDRGLEPRAAHLKAGVNMANHMPSDPGRIRQDQDRVALWNPNTCANWSYLFTPIFGSLLQHYNWKTLGNAKEAKVSLMWCLAFVGFTAVALMGFIDARLPALVLLLAWYFLHARKQVHFVQKLHGDSYVHKTFITPLLVAVSTIVGIVLISAGALSGWGGFSIFKPTLPKVDAPEVIAAAEKALADSKLVKLAGAIIGKIKIINSKELKSHSDDEKRMARAQITTNLGNETVYYSVEWQDEAAKTFWVEFHEKPD